MNPELEGQNLIFLISQPRAGSTLSQQIFGNHPDIWTMPEPWLMLHPLYALKQTGYEAEYNANYAQAAVQEFLNVLPNGEQIYLESIRQMSAHLYGAAIAASGRRYFLDKTPRYYFIIPELQKVFPKAHFIILLRNPLAVLCSILSTWTKGNWFSLRLHQPDIIQAPALLLEGMRSLDQQCLVLHYEELLTNPSQVLEKICNRLDIEFLPDIIHYDGNRSFQSAFGDKKSVNQYTQPNSKNLERWILDLQDPQVWRLVNDYLEFLGAETMQSIGYSYDELKQILEENRPSSVYLWLTFSLFDFLDSSNKPALWKHHLTNLNRFLAKHGSGATFSHVVQTSFDRSARKAGTAQHIQ
jgi:hypothetical protein